MLQVVGGSDRLPAAFAARLKDRIIYRAVAREIRQTERSVSVVYTDQNGRLVKAEAEYCVCALPLTVLARLQTDFPPSSGEPPVRQPTRPPARSDCSSSAGSGRKTTVFMEARRGPIRRLLRCAPVGFHGRKGIVIGYYIQGDAGRPMGERSPGERQAMALEQGGRIDPQYRGDFETAFSVGWHRVTWIRGSWVSFSADIRRELPTLRRPDGRVYLAEITLRDERVDARCP